jgi:hypothetical protein
VPDITGPFPVRLQAGDLLSEAALLLEVGDRHLVKKQETPGACCVIPSSNRLRCFANQANNLEAWDMAQKIQTLFIDDIDGGAAEGTVRFGLDGTEYEIDLSTRHTEELRRVLADYATHGRKVGGTTRRAPRGRGSGAGAVDSAKVREWAKESGYSIKDRGRVPANVVEKYKAAVGA